jgi:PPM family protein phosphatase
MVNALSSRSALRPQNEDAITIGAHILTGAMDAPAVMTAPKDSCLLMIADGMGGHAHGVMASRVARCMDAPAAPKSTKIGETG